MIRLFLLASLLLLLPSIPYCQTQSITANPLLRQLFRSGKQSTVVRFMNEGLEIPGPTYLENIRAKTVIRNKKGLFLMIYGKGRVYRVIEADQEKTVIERIDSTFFFGNNFNSIDFSFKDSLFSYGGYGFWRFNGQLRYFTDGSEWNIVRLNSEEPVNSECFFYDEVNAQLYYIQTPLKQEYITAGSNQYFLCRLDLKNRTVTRTGELTNPDLFSKAKRCFTFPALNGMLIESSDAWYLIEPGSNRVLKLVNQSLHNWLTGSSTYRSALIFADSNNLFSYSENEDTLRSIAVSIKDFNPETTTLYKAQESVAPRIWYWLLPSLIVLVIGFVYVKRKTKNTYKKPLDDNSPTADTETAETGQEGFTEAEKSLIQNFLTRKGTDSFVTVEELNYWLGLGKKTIEIQKKVRRESLNRINIRFRELGKTDTDLIQAERSETDRRYYNYFISKENAALYYSLIDVKLK